MRRYRKLRKLREESVMHARLALKDTSHLSEPQQSSRKQAARACLAAPVKRVQHVGSGIDGKSMSAKLVLSTFDGSWHVHQLRPLSE
eukprot:2885963-Pleurochrysis_carterae.AAC.1